MLYDKIKPFGRERTAADDTLKSTNATFRWGTKTGRELETLCPGLTLMRENSLNDVMKTFTFFGWLFGTLLKIRDCNDRLAVFRYNRSGG